MRRLRGYDGAPDGLVSTYLQDCVGEGDTLDVGPFVGDVTLDTSASPLVLISAGVGITYTAALLDDVAENQPNRKVISVHADRSPGSHALMSEIALHASQLTDFDTHGNVNEWCQERDLRPGPGLCRDPDGLPRGSLRHQFSGDRRDVSRCLRAANVFDPGRLPGRSRDAVAVYLPFRPLPVSLFTGFASDNRLRVDLFGLRVCAKWEECAKYELRSEDGFA